ncbi:MAG: ATPase [Gammaproteobacteria bacterium]|nr:ATPase [Gammaproteobacteria bacterium]
MKSADAYSAPLEDKRPWRPLIFFNYYRIALILLLVALIIGESLPAPLGSSHPQLFFQLSLFYLLIAVFATISLLLRRPGFYTQLLLLVGVDITCITLLMHFSGGVSSGMGILLVVSIASNSMLVSGQLPPLLAAAATIAILIEQTFTATATPVALINYPYAGLLGAALFSTAILTHTLARRVHESEAQVAQHEIDIANLAQLAEFAVEKMETGVIAFDKLGKIHLFNSAARKMIGIEGEPAQSISALPEVIMQIITDPANQNLSQNLSLLRDDDESFHLSLHPINNSGRRGTLLFLEDNRSAIKRSRELKMAALGRLTAGIAHEIRNPIAAISHASQLLAESPQLNPTDLRMTEIIANNVQRMEEIVTSILQLGRKDQCMSEKITLFSWLQALTENLLTAQQLDKSAITINLTPNSLSCYFDAAHLQIIISNLIANGLRHANPAHYPLLRIVGRQEKSAVNIDIYDSGQGVAAENQQRLFEPFFTTESRGTGLGLYISRELAQGNQAELSYHYAPSGGSHFRLSIEHLTESTHVR